MVLPPAAPQLIDLDLLLSVDRLGSLGKAAREHGVSQPAASLRIQAMERRLGLRLLERSTSGSRLTPAGAALAKWAQTAVDAVSQLMACSAALNDAGARSLRISACLTMAECLNPRWLMGLRDQFPDLRVSVQANDLQDVIADARAGRVDLGFVGESAHYPDLHQRVVGHDELVIVVAPDHPWARLQAPLSPAELSSGRLVLRDEGFGTRETLRQALGGLWRDNAHLELPSTAAVKEAVEVGAGAGVLSSLTTGRDLREGRMVRVPVADLELTRKLCAVWARDSEQSPAATALLDFAVNAQRSAVGPAWRTGRSQQPWYGDVCPLPTSQRPAPMAQASAS